MSRAARFVTGLAALALWGCGADKPGDAPRPSVEPPPPSPSQQTDDARKRECVATLTAAADPELHTLLRSLCSEWVENQVPGIALAIAEPGKPVFHVELGVRCHGEAAPVTATTAFRLGSDSKPITAALALGLVEAGTLALDSDASIVPGFAAQAGLASPRLDALLRHRSGIGEIEPAILVELDGAWLPALTRSPAAGAPGEYHYSNAGYAVIGAMLEQASGRDYAELVAERVAAPLGLTRLSADPTIDDASCGHLASDPERRPIAVATDLEFMPGDPRWMAPAGGLLASASDLARFALAIGTDALPGTAAMLDPGEAIPPGQIRTGHVDECYGFGLRSWKVDSSTDAYGHTGNNVGFITELMFVPERRAIVLLGNSGVELPATRAAADALLSRQTTKR